LQIDKKLNVFFPAIDIEAEKEQAQVEPCEKNIEYDPVVLHEGGFIP